MSPAPSAFGAASEHVSFEVEDLSFDVLTLEGEEEISTFFRFELKCAVDADFADPEPLLGKEARIEIRDGTGLARTIRGIVAEGSTRIFDEGRTLLTLVVRPAVYRLTAGRDCRVYQDSTVPQIVAEVLGRAGLPHRFELGGHYAERVYTQQYREDDWTFIQRLLEDEGIYYWFDHEEGDSQLIMSDGSESAPELVGGAAITWAAQTGMQTNRETVHQFGAANLLTEDRHAVRSFDPQRIQLEVTGERGGGRLEVYDARGAGPVDPAHAAERARVRTETAKARRSTVTGASSSIRIVPGRRLEISGHNEKRLDGRFFVTGSTLAVVQRQGDNGSLQAKPPECLFRGLRDDRPFRPVAITAWPRQHGLQTGVVVGPPGEEIHIDEQGAVRLQYHWDRQGVRDDQAGKWMRVVQRGTAGSMLLPRMGWNVISFNEEGSVDQPLILSRVFDAEHPPPYALPDYKTRTVYKTATTPSDGTANEIRLDDLAGSEEMFLHASRDMNIRVQDSKSEQVQGNQLRSIAINQSIDVGQNQSLTVLSNQTETISGNESNSTGSGQNKTVNGNESNTVGGTRSISTGDTLTQNITNLRCLLVGGAQIDITLGHIDATSPVMATLVGGAAVKATLRNLEETVGAGGVTQLIGALKVESALGERAITVTGAYTETIGAKLTHTTSTTYLDKATNWKLQVGGTMVAKGATDVGEADTVVLQCGGSVITISSGSIEVKTSTLDLSSADPAAANSPAIGINA